MKAANSLLPGLLSVELSHWKMTTKFLRGGTDFHDVHNPQFLLFAGWATDGAALVHHAAIQLTG
jgi:hypothetical protein